MTSEKKTSAYKFKHNLLKVSENQNFEDAVQEWKFVDCADLEFGEVQCICQHSIAKVNYLYNIKTQYTIAVGKDCFIKFRLKNQTLEDATLHDLLKRCLREKKGEYKTIADMEEYCRMVQAFVIEAFEAEFQGCKLMYYEFVMRLYLKIYGLIRDYNITYLEALLGKMRDFIESDYSKVVAEFRYRDCPSSLSWEFSRWTAYEAFAFMQPFVEQFTKKVRMFEAVKKWRTFAGKLKRQVKERYQLILQKKRNEKSKAEEIKRAEERVRQFEAEKYKEWLNRRR